MDKPVGPTSHDVVALVRRLAGQRRLGHGGTLDPFASGVLPLYLGRATRLAEYHLGADKEYRATICFGATSTTDDLEGELRAVPGEALTREAVEAALASFVGTVLQQPPAFSARKVAGRRAYALARAGLETELQPRQVTFHRLELVDWDGTDPERPMAVVTLACSAGTYVRALARDIGAAVGSGAYLGALRRTAAGPFTLTDAVALDAVREAAAAGRLASLLQPTGTGLDHLPCVRLADEEAAVAVRGGWLRLPRDADVRADAGGPIRLVDEGGRLVAIGRLVAGRLVPDKVLVDLPAVAGGASVVAEVPVDAGDAAGA
ncbi:MAG: tRNA pseudouridine(55) synthase TruB [Chloroflexi bacterium]|nr:tRNA pseudouridine(55) synthase TruB [Chloroflexota bacterium]